MNYKILRQCELLKKIRNEIGATQEDISSEEIKRETIGQIERGCIKKISKENLILLVNNINKYISENKINHGLITKDDLIISTTKQIEIICSDIKKEINVLKMSENRESELEDIIIEFEKFSNKYLIDSHYILDIYKCIISYYREKLNFKKAKEFIFKSIEISVKASDDNKKIEMLTQYMIVFISIKKYNEALDVAEFINIFLKKNDNLDKKYSMSVLYNMALAYRNTECIDKCLNTLKELQNKYSFTDAQLNDIRTLEANCYYKKGHYEKSEDLHLKVLDYCISVNNKNDTAREYKNLADIYLKTNRLELAVEHITNSLSILVNDDNYLKDIYNCALEIYITKKDINLVEIYFNKALSKAEKLKDKDTQIELYNKIICYYRENKMTYQMKKILDQLEESTLKNNFNKNDVISIYYISVPFLGKGDIDIYYQKGLNLIKSLDIQEKR